jgi:hypothetical protein
MTQSEDEGVEKYLRSYNFQCTVNFYASSSKIASLWLFRVYLQTVCPIDGLMNGVCTYGDAWKMISCDVMAFHF